MEQWQNGHHVCVMIFVYASMALCYEFRADGMKSGNEK